MVCQDKDFRRRVRERLTEGIVVGRESWRRINEAEEAISLSVESCCIPISPSSQSPIDEFYDYIASLVPLGDPRWLGTYAALGRMLLLGIVAGTESYFRTVLAGSIDKCPLSRRAASEQTISFGAIDYYHREELALGLLEGTSFSTEGEILKKTQKLTGLELHQDGSLQAAIKGFHRVCSLRHASAHAEGQLSSANIRALDLQTARSRRGVQLDFAAFQSVVKISYSVVRAYNRGLYCGLVQRWLENAELGGTWRVDKPLFEPVFNLFRSRYDDVAPPHAYAAYLSLRPAILARLGG